MKKKLFAIALFISITSTNCGTITGLHSAVELNTNPQGATVILNEKIVGKTPLKVKLKNNVDYDLVIRYSDFPDYIVFIDSYISGSTVIADILFTFLTGIVIDACTGGLYKNKDLHRHRVLHDFNIGKTKIEKMLLLN